MQVREFRPMTSGALVGFCTVELPSGMVVHDCTVFDKDGRRWVNPPGRPQLDKSKQVVVKDGRVQYSPALSFASKDRYSAFSDAVIAELDALGHFDREVA